MFLSRLTYCYKAIMKLKLVHVALAIAIAIEELHFFFSANLKALPYNATDVSHKESDQEPVDFQKIALNV